MAGTPDVLTGAPASPRRRWLTLALVLVVAGVTVIVALVGSGRQGPGPAAGPTASSAVTSTSQPRATRTTIDPANRIAGSLPVSSDIPTGAAAIAAAQFVADSYCEQISSWRVTIDGENGEYLNVVVLLRPAGPAYRNVLIQVELMWTGDHYDWAGSRTALESCP